MTPELCRDLIALEATGGSPAPEACHQLAARTGVAPVDFGGAVVMVPYVVRDDWAVAGGDMILGPASGFGGPAHGAMTAWAGFHWPDGRVPYVVDGLAAEDERTMLEAMRAWEAVASVHFTERVDEAAYVKIVVLGEDPVAAGRSSVGRQPDESQPQLLQLKKQVSLSTALHELGHALGMFHEHQRPGRGAYIDVFPDNAVLAGDQFDADFAELDTTAALWTDEYDERSIMHYASISKYSKKDASGKQLPVLTRKDGTYLEHQTSLSHGDACAVNMVYDPDRYRRECATGDDATDCADRVGVLSWSCHGPWRDEHCAHVFGTEELTAWGDNFICGDPRELEAVWFLAGSPPSGAPNCVALANPLDPHGWSQTELCTLPTLRGLSLESGYVEGKQCLRIYEPDDPVVAWNDRYLCWNCVVSDPAVEVEVRAGFRTVTAGTCGKRVDWIVPLDAKVRLAVSATSDVGITSVAAIGSGTLWCGGVGAISTPPTRQDFELEVLKEERASAAEWIPSSAVIDVASLVANCESPRLALSVQVTATRSDGVITSEDIALHAPTR